jgi:hypothetical protein
MTIDIDALLEGAPSYGVVDAKDGFLLYGRPGHEKAFEAVAAEVEAAAEGFDVVPLRNDDDRCDRLFIAPLREEKSFAR